MLARFEWHCCSGIRQVMPAAKNQTPILIRCNARHNEKKLFSYPVYIGRSGCIISLCVCILEIKFTDNYKDRVLKQL